MLKSVIAAFSMFSIIPMPEIQFTDKAMKHILLFFPLVGAVIGITAYFARKAMIYTGFGEIFICAVMTAIPVIITGGIHADGFTDTLDGIFSYGSRKKRLEILSDPHIGALGAVWTMLYFIVSIGLWSEIKSNMFVVCAGFVLSRTLSAISIIKFPKAKETGIVCCFSRTAAKGSVYILGIYLFIEAFIIIKFSALCGIFALAAAAAAFALHWLNCSGNFGGITGDTAGFFIEVCEIMILFSAVIYEKAEAMI